MNRPIASLLSSLRRPLRKVVLPGLLVVVMAALVGGAGLLVLQTPAALGRPEPRPVSAKDMEVVWLYPATSTASWERFVAAMQQTGEHLHADHPDIDFQVDEAFPLQSAAVPEIALRWKASGRRLVFRWYKLTGKQKTADWVDALLHRNPPPLAIVGGNTSDAARDLATQLKAAAATLPEEQRPLLLFTTATADDFVRRAAAADARALVDQAPPVALNEIYAGRTFRFCFTNRQMATAVTRFVWQHDELRRDCGVAHMVCWEDDAYSRDLIDGFWRALATIGNSSTPTERAWALGCLLRGAVGPDFGCAFAPYQPLGADGPPRLAVRIAPTPPLMIDSSVGTFDVPNRLESQAARDLLTALVAQPNQGRPLLAVTGQSAPSRRFLRALVRNAPEQTRRCVVATGDAIAFNTIYRDGAVTWPIQDLQYRLVFFCHHNPIDRASGFRPFEEVGDNGSSPGLTATTGTEDLLLFGDIVEALALCSEQNGQACQNAGAMAERFHDLHMREGKLTFDELARPLFNAAGNRHSGTGEHVVYLAPEFQGVRVLPRSVIEVWSWVTEGAGESTTSTWKQAAGSPLLMRYDRMDPTGEGP